MSSSSAVTSSDSNSGSSKGGRMSHTERFIAAFDNRWVSPANMVIAFFVLCNIASVVGIVAINKTIYREGFKLPSLLMSFHFFCTWLFVVFAQRSDWFVEKRIASKHYFTLGFAQMCSVVFVNLSLVFNTVEFFMRGKIYSVGIYVTLVVLVIGISCATVSEVDFSFIGLVCGLVGALSSAAYQVLNKKIQVECDVQPLQLLQFEQPYSAGFSLAVSLLSDDYSSIAKTQWSGYLLVLLLLSGVAAFGVNVTTYSIIGKTSPITFGVVGHTKTLGILAYGFLVLQEDATANKLLGFLTATVAMITYTHLTTVSPSATSSSAAALSHSAASANNTNAHASSIGGALAMSDKRYSSKEDTSSLLRGAGDDAHGGGGGGASSSAAAPNFDHDAEYAASSHKAN